MIACPAKGENTPLFVFVADVPVYLGNRVFHDLIICRLSQTLHRLPHLAPLAF